MRKDDWAGKPRSAKLANVLFPYLADADTQKEMQTLAANEGKKGPTQQPLLPDHSRGHVSPLGNVAVPDPRWQKKGKK